MATDKVFNKQLYEAKELTKNIKLQLKETISQLETKPSCMIIKVGELEASNRYVKHKIKDMDEVGITHNLVELPNETTTEEIISIIHNSNEDAIFVQLPLPNHINEEAVLNSIAPHKDVDGLGFINVGKLFCGANGFKPATPSGVLDIIDDIGYDLTGKHCVVLGRSVLAGKSMAMMLLDRNATVTILHSKSKNIKKITRDADIVISAIGKSKFIDHTYISDETLCIDIGINFDEYGKLCGDFDTQDIYSHRNVIITNTPGGCGLTTRTGLLKNILQAHLINQIN